ncbi:hypothetical protein BVRB_3g056010 [Beta vulgaris subsp. vulgaris]|uniref:Pectinesterase n=2 Tax=Beta vulgaris subsp. vulgaris TaxID=3555 RepID=A0A0J8CV34_BETVV|nr:hypothetical protein BVRB_3g056010 [Beta vulgaris subsp. vulgaris]
MMIQIALDRTRFSHNQTKELIHKLKNNEHDKVAWADCLTLYENTISELNKTLNPTKKYRTEFDKQTWLSTALTNLETCKSELFDQLGHVLDFIPPHIYNNVSELISNGLAMHNKLAIPQTQTYKLGFPTWVTRRDRKLLQSSSTKAANLVVAKDGSGNFKTIREALDAAAKRTRSSGRFVIHIKSGVYAEYLRIGTDLKNIMLVGDGMESTIITGNRSKGGGFTIFTSATVAVTSDGFIARDITFRNTAGPQNNQAVALRVGSDLSVFYKCGFEGYQDTLYAHSQRQFYRECNIYGTIDFIFGNAASIFQNCNIFVRKPLSSQKNVVTAQGRTDPNQNTGIIIQKSRIAPSSDLKPVISSFPTYLGRPWKKYSRTIFMENFLDSFINPSGWLKWDGSKFAPNTLFYGEYKNYGPGSSTSERVNWGGYKIFTSVAQVSQFSVANFIGGQSWLPAAGVPFSSGI